MGVLSIKIGVEGFKTVVLSSKTFNLVSDVVPIAYFYNLFVFGCMFYVVGCQF